MSAILKEYLKPQIEGVVKGNSNVSASSSEDVNDQRTKLIEELSSAIAVAVQQYLLQNVTVIPGQAVVVTTSGGPTNQAGGGTTVSPGLLNAP
jgi:hypothetical protein